jgi:acyl-CoA thioesterase-1
MLLRALTLLVLLALPVSVMAASATNSDPVKTSATAIMVLGDSISAAFGMAREQGWVALLEQYVNEHYRDKNYQIINASISGETTAGALARLPQLLAQHQPAIVIIELGGNDGLRGFPISNFRDNLDQLVTHALSAKARVLLTGMQIPPNYGPRYTDLFYASYGIIAQKNRIPLVPFLLQNVAVYPNLMQADGIHPVSAAQPRILQTVLTHLQPML